MRRSAWTILVCLGLSTLTFSGAMAQPAQGLVFKTVMVGEDQSQEPLPNVFVYVSPTSFLKQPKLADWLKKHAAPPAKEKLLTYEVQDGQLHPRAAIAYVGDSVELQTSQQARLALTLFAHPGNGLIKTEFKFTMPEPTIMSVSLVAYDKGPHASMLITDHTLSRLTDAQGRAVFAEFPADMPLPVKVRLDADQKRDDYELSSDTLRIVRGYEFMVDTAQPSQEHVIQIRKKAGNVPR